MEVTVKSTKVAKTGTNKSGEWELIVVVSEDNTEYTTFDKKAKQLNQGSVISIEPVIKEGKCSFKDFKLISEGVATSERPDSTPGMTPELWAEKDRLERWSRECNTCFMGIIELAKSPPTEWRQNKIQTEEQFAKVFSAALDWATLHFTTKPQQDEPKKTSQPAPNLEQAKKDIKELWLGEQTELGKLDFDSDWLTESLTKIKWGDTTVKSYLKNVYKVDTEGTVVEMVVKLTREDREAFFGEIQKQLGK